MSFISGNLITEDINTPMVFTTNATSLDQVPDFWREGIPIVYPNDVHGEH